MPDFDAVLLRERFVLENQASSGEHEGDNSKIALSNRLDFDCIDASGQHREKFVVRAQNIHTCLRAAALIAQQWYDHAHLNKSGAGRFQWKREYHETIKEFEEKWNPDCWASVYKNGHILFESGHKQKTELLDVIEQVYSHEKGDYDNIAQAAEQMFLQAGKKVSITYDHEQAMDLQGDPKEVQNKLTYRDPKGRNLLEMTIQQRGAAVKLSECLNVAAVIFEGYQLGYIIGQTNYDLAKGKITIRDKRIEQSDHALRRIKRLEDYFEHMTYRYKLTFEPAPNFRKNIKNVEAFLRKTGH